MPIKSLNPSTPLMSKKSNKIVFIINSSNLTNDIIFTFNKNDKKPGLLIQHLPFEYTLKLNFGPIILKGTLCKLFDGQN